MATPSHIGIIIDGNRRWAKARKRPTLVGHRAGLRNVKIVARAAFRQGVKIVTIFAFSTENWQRDQKEVDYLIKLFTTLVKTEIKELIKNDIKVRFFGRAGDFPASMRQAMKEAAKLSSKGKSGQLNVCLSYGGRDEIVRAVKKIIKSGLPAQEIDEEIISRSLDTAYLPDPDLIIRTSGEQRLSGFLTWQSVYSELYFSPKFWPDFGPDDLAAAIFEYKRRCRRFGAN